MYSILVVGITEAGVGVREAGPVIGYCRARSAVLFVLFVSLVFIEDL